MMTKQDKLGKIFEWVFTVVATVSILIACWQIALIIVAILAFFAITEQCRRFVSWWKHG